MPLPLAVAGGIAAIQVGKGLYDTYQANKGLDAMGEREAYEVPQSVAGATNISRNMAREGVPQATMNLQRQNLDRLQTSSLAQMGSRKAGLAGVAGLSQSLADSYTQLAAQDAQARINNMNNYQSQLNLQGQYEEKALLDRQGNYDVARAGLLGRREAGQNQIMAGLQTGANAMGLMGGGAGKTNPQETAVTPMQSRQATGVQSQSGVLLNNQTGLAGYTPTMQPRTSGGVYSMGGVPYGNQMGLKLNP